MEKQMAKNKPLSDADARLRQPAHHGVGAGYPNRNSKTLSSWIEPGSEANRQVTITRNERIGIAALVVLAAFVRLWKIWQPASVVFDEVHFGGFARKYIKQGFFMDVHPPLAKLLITLAALVGGFNGNFDFKDIGKEYTGEGVNVPYVTMRMLPGLFGVAVVPIAYLTLRALGTRKVTAAMGGALVIFENGLVTQSRLILLDSPLIFFTALTALLWVRFCNEDYSGIPFGKSWWTYLFLTGLSLGAVVSCKWVGLFTIATVGLCVLRQLWLLLGNLKVSPRTWCRHFAARALCLIVVPVLFYMFMFQIHFWVLNKSGDGDGFMTSEFQHTLRGHGMDDTFADVSIGSSISIRHVHTQGGYLHSHPHNYPGGSKQQQITLYPHRDDNNLWKIVKAVAESNPVNGTSAEEMPLTHVENGMKIRLEHISTEKRLHSHDVRAPVSEADFQNEVSGYGFPGFDGDANDDFIVEITPSTRGGQDKSKATKRLRTLRSHFRLRHAMTGCYLFSHKVKLPEWGFDQQEVTCNKNPPWKNSLWYIETNTHQQLTPKDEKVNYHRPGFMAKFLELQRVMWDTNAGLTERHAYDSRPNHWPWLRRGINFWVKDHRQIYLIGNPLIWWNGTLAVAVYLIVRGLIVLREKRGFKDLRRPLARSYDEICGFLTLAWALHYLPFFLMQRQLFLHHYFPALYFSVLCFAATFDIMTRHVKVLRRIQIVLVFLLLVMYAFSHFSPLAYGNPWTRSQCESSKYLKTWDFSCNDFQQEYADYSIPNKSDVEENKGSGAAQSSSHEDLVEPIPNVFEELKEKEGTEDQTLAPQNDVPVGRDAGAIQHTADDLQSDHQSDMMQMDPDTIVL